MKSPLLTRFLVACGLMALAGLGARSSFAHTGLVPPSLASIKLPPVPGLTDGDRPIVVNRDWGILLGKALFWDMNLGSDGMACASCHFHAGADSRTRNQFSPGKAHLPASPTDANGFDPIDTRGPNLSNHQLKRSDFPLYFNGTYADTYNVVASSGTFSGNFVKVHTKDRHNDVCEPFSGAELDHTFNVGGVRTRRVEPRNAPTFINSVLFDRNFWDGRANNMFNGVSSWGSRDPDAFVWVVDENSALQKNRLALPNASVASLAVGPALNEFEMSCKGRTWPDIARKLLKRHPLERQAVHPDDSRLGGVHRDPSGKGLKYTYEFLVQQAFAPRYWLAGIRPEFGKPSYSSTEFSQMEANFSMFFGIAIQLYGETLISDDTRFDRSSMVESPPGSGSFTDQNGIMGAAELEGFKLFNELHCIFCHTGPVFSSATNRTTYFTDGKATTRSMVDRRENTEFATLLFDTGFHNNGAVPDADDPGLAGLDEYGNPLSFAAQYRSFLTGKTEEVVDDPLPLIEACTFPLSFVTDFPARQLRDDPFAPPGTHDCVGGKEILAKVPTPSAARKHFEDRLGLGVGAFKVPQLYNIELTGPYFHNGGAASLSEVIDQYMRAQPAGNGGNFTNAASTFILLPRPLSEAEKSAIVAFLKSLTDERVRNESAPFDHPELVVFDGHPGNGQSVTPNPNHPDRAKDRKLRINAVGKLGRTAEGLAPLQPFDELLKPN